MITIEEYNKAVNIVEKYHKQVENKIRAKKTLACEWYKLDECSTRLRGLLMFRLGEDYIEDINYEKFKRTRNAGSKSWYEFEKLRGY